MRRRKRSTDDELQADRWLSERVADDVIDSPQ
jgi:hypothetical protein